MGEFDRFDDECFRYLRYTHLMASVNSEENWFVAFEKALEFGPLRIEGSEVDLAIYHITRQLLDATLLFRNGRWPTATFLAITALEEVAKTHVAMFHKPRSESGGESRKGPPYSHRKKYVLAAAPTIPMGRRLGEAIGEQRVKDLMELASSGQLISLRESCLYMDKMDGKLKIPTEVISKEVSKELLLFALEAFDDALVGLTNYSYDMGKITDKLFAEMAKV